jgi:peptide deformylase
MAIRKIARLGHPVLRVEARELTPDEIKSEATRTLIADMVDTLHEYGGIGLAAPQVHESLQLAIIEFTAENARYPDMGNQPLSVFINPKVTVLDPKEQFFWEGCLSVPDLKGQVFRPRKIQIDYLDLQAKAQRLVAEDFLATVFQHEFDHLKGTLYIDRLRAVDGRVPLTFTDEYRKYYLPQQGSAQDLDE